MDVVWKGMIGGLVTAAIVWLSRAAISCPVSCRCFRPSP